MTNGSFPRAATLTALALFCLAGCRTTADDTPPDFLGTPQAQVMLLGTFHFKDAGLDGYKPQHDVDIMSVQRQRELDEVLDQLERYAPTKIAVEWPAANQVKLDQQYNAWREGTFELGPNETYQIGFALAGRMGHERVYAVDAQGRMYDMGAKITDWARAHGQEHLLKTEWDARYRQMYEHKDRAKTQRSLRETFLFLNDEEQLLRSHGHYLVGQFKLADGNEYYGADQLSGWWYNRNLRIFSNIVRLVDKPGERILVLIGSGHVPIIRHAVQASPEVQLVEVSNFL